MKICKGNVLFLFLRSGNLVKLPLLFLSAAVILTLSTTLLAGERYAKNISVMYDCAEDDTVSVPFFGYTTAYRVIATFPKYYEYLPIDQKQQCQPDWRGWIPHPPPHVACYDQTNGQLLYIMRGLGTMGDWWRKPLVLDTGTGISHVSLGEVRHVVRVGDTGEPTNDFVWPGGTDTYILYYQNTGANSGVLKCIYEGEATSGVFGTPMVLDSAGDAGKFNSIALEARSKTEQIPHIVYYDETNGNLNYLSRESVLKHSAKDFSSTIGGIELVSHISMASGATIRSVGAGSATYNVNFPSTLNPPNYITLTYAGNIGGGEVDVYFDGSLKGSFTSEVTDPPMFLIKEGEDYISEYSSGNLVNIWHESAGDKQTVSGDGIAVYKLDFAAGIENLSAETIHVRYTDDIGGGKIRVYIDDILQNEWVSQQTETINEYLVEQPGAWNLTPAVNLTGGSVTDSGSHVVKLEMIKGSSNLEVDYIHVIGGLKFRRSPMIPIGQVISAGAHTIRLDITPNASNLEIDNFSVIGWSFGFGNPQVIDGGKNAGQYTSLDIDQDMNLHLAYYDVDKGNLKYLYKPSGGLWNDPVTIAGTNKENVGKYASLSVAPSGYPHIAYYNETNNTLEYIYEDASGWQTPVEIDTNGGQYSAIGVNSSGYPRIAYCRDNDLKYAYKDSAGWHYDMIDNSPNDIAYISLMVYPLPDEARNNWLDATFISYQDVTEGSVKFTYKKRFAESTWAPIETAASGGIGQYAAMSLSEYAVPVEGINVNGEFLPGVDSATLFDNIHTNVEVFVLPGWWRENTMRVETPEGYADNIVQLNVLVRLADDDKWSQIIAMYSSGHLRLLPPAIPGEEFSCFGSSVMMGSVEANWPAKYATGNDIGIDHAVEWPSCDIKKVVMNPVGAYMDIYHYNGGSERVHWYAERGTAKLEVRDITHNTVDYPFTVLRSMWVNDDRCVLSHVFTEGLPYPGQHIMREEEGFIENYRDPWVLEGDWWAFHRPNYCPYNTSNPDTR
ncbi:MAG: hypothetical protein KAQ99_01515, partial [Candidatus Aureabacteria bacterium]|nr:hypothetical protein [Candidatus Auribacterota bacterium]